MITFDHHNLPFRFDNHSVKLKSHDKAFCLDEKQKLFPSETQHKTISKPKVYFFEIDTLTTCYVAQHTPAPVYDIR
jgi:hypothetical protein